MPQVVNDFYIIAHNFVSRTFKFMTVILLDVGTRIVDIAILQ